MNIMDRRYRDLTVGIAYGRMLERTGEEPDMERLYEIYDRSQKNTSADVINTVILFVFLLIFLIVFSLVSWMFIIPLIIAAFFFVRYIGKMQNRS